MEKWGKANVIAASVSAIVSACLLGLAIWGIFFTSAPEKIVERLSSDVSLAKQELEVSLREKQILDEKIEWLRKERDSFFDQNASVVKQYENAKARLEKLNNKERERYVIYKKQSINILLKLAGSKINVLKRNALIISEYKVSNDYVRSQPDKKDNDFENKYKKWFNGLLKHHIESFRDTMFDDIAIASGNTDIKYSSKRIIPTLLADKMIQSFDKSAIPETGLSFLTKIINEYKFLEPDVETYEEIKILILSNTQSRKIYSNPIEPSLFESFSESKVTQQGIDSLMVITAIEMMLQEIRLKYA